MIAVAVGLSLVAHQAVHFWRRRVVFAATTPPDSSFISEHLTVCVSSSAGSVPPSNNRPNTSFAQKPVRGAVALAPTGRRRRPRSTPRPPTARKRSGRAPHDGRWTPCPSRGARGTGSTPTTSFPPPRPAGVHPPATCGRAIGPPGAVRPPWPARATSSRAWPTAGGPVNPRPRQGPAPDRQGRALGATPRRQAVLYIPSSPARPHRSNGSRRRGFLAPSSI